MGRFDNTKATINANIKQNGNQEITGQIMNNVLTEVVNATDAELTELESKESQLAKEIAEAEQRVLGEVERVADAVDDIKPIVINGDVTNAADEEDITSEGNLLKLKDRSALNGMGYVILRKNKTFAEQVIKPNTIYEIRYDFQISTCRIPDNCKLFFNGGEISGTTIDFNGCEILGIARIFVETFIGNINNDVVHADWFIQDAASDCGAILSNLIKAFKHIQLGSQSYTLLTPIIIDDHDRVLSGRDEYLNTQGRLNVKCDYGIFFTCNCRRAALRHICLYGEVGNDDGGQYLHTAIAFGNKDEVGESVHDITLEYIYIQGFHTMLSVGDVINSSKPTTLWNADFKHIRGYLNDNGIVISSNGGYHFGLKFTSVYIGDSATLLDVNCQTDAIFESCNFGVSLGGFRFKGFGIIKFVGCNFETDKYQIIGESGLSSIMYCQNGKIAFDSSTFVGKGVKGTYFISLGSALNALSFSNCRYTQIAGVQDNELEFWHPSDIDTQRFGAISMDNNNSIPTPNLLNYGAIYADRLVSPGIIPYFSPKRDRKYSEATSTLHDLPFRALGVNPNKYDEVIFRAKYSATDKNGIEDYRLELTRADLINVGDRATRKSLTDIPEYFSFFDTDLCENVRYYNNGWRDLEGNDIDKDTITFVNGGSVSVIYDKTTQKDITIPANDTISIHSHLGFVMPSDNSIAEVIFENGYYAGYISSLAKMFSRKSNIAKIDLQNIVKLKPISLSESFQSQESLLKMYGTEAINTSEVTSMLSMFAYSKNMRALDLSSWDTRKVQTIKWAFLVCELLKTLNLDNWDLRSCTNCLEAFYRCSSLETLILGKDFFRLNTSSIDFSPCTKWTNFSVRRSLVENLYDRTAYITLGTLSALEIKVSAATLAVLTDEDKNIITAKGYTIVA